MSLIDTRGSRLATLRAQAERLPPWEGDAVLDAFETADVFLEDLDRISRERYRAEREEEEIAVARRVAVGGFANVFEAIDAAVAAERSRTVDAFDGERATRVRESRRLADVVDTDALLNADDPRTVRNLVEAAESYGVGAEARAMALRVVRPRAADEQRRGRQNGEWFAALCWLSGSSVTTTTDRHEVGSRVDARRDALRALVREVASVVGVSAGLARVAQETATAPMPDVKPSTHTVGRWWDDNPTFRRS